MEAHKSNSNNSTSYRNSTSKRNGSIMPILILTNLCTNIFYTIAQSSLANSTKSHQPWFGNFKRRTTHLEHKKLLTSSSL